MVSSSNTDKAILRNASISAENTRTEQAFVANLEQRPQPSVKKTSIDLVIFINQNYNFCIPLQRSWLYLQHEIKAGTS
jgi:hypothetical protein